eukprot:UN34418
MSEAIELDGMSFESLSSPTMTDAEETIYYQWVKYDWDVIECPTECDVEEQTLRTREVLCVGSHGLIGDSCIEAKPQTTDICPLYSCSKTTIVKDTGNAVVTTSESSSDSTPIIIAVVASVAALLIFYIAYNKLFAEKSVDTPAKYIPETVEMQLRDEGQKPTTNNWQTPAGMPDWNMMPSLEAYVSETVTYGVSGAEASTGASGNEAITGASGNEAILSSDTDALQYSTLEGMKEALDKDPNFDRVGELIIEHKLCDKGDPASPREHKRTRSRHASRHDSGKTFI